MAQRPLLTSIFAFVVAAAAVHVASGPANPRPLGATESEATTPTVTPAASTGAQTSWAELMTRDPKAAGRASGMAELQGKICAFVAADASVCPAAANGEQRAMYAQAPEVMIAVGPDPVQTQLALQFDRLIDGFEDALQDSGWEYQGSWMPWPTPGNSAESGDFDKREERRLFLEGREGLPGVLLFRPADRAGTQSRNSPQRGPLVVFVIGDSPTIGVNPRQMAMAARMFASMTPPDAPLRILGPTFTGSGPSMQALLRDLKTSTLGSRAIHVASGTVVDWQCDHILPNLPRGRGSGRGDSCENGPDTYVSFGEDVTWELQQASFYLMQHRGLRSRDIAVLTEDESGFGSLNSPAPARKVNAARGATRRPDKSDPDDGMGREARDETLVLHFPRSISHLRAAYQKNAIFGFGGSSGGASSVSLNLDFAEPHHATDSVQEYAPQQMPVSQEGSMGQVAATLEEHNIKVVLLTATDVLDEMFVAEILARQSPNVMVVVRGTDVLFLRSGVRGVYHNLYAMGPWPLIPRNYTWSKAADIQPPIRTFSNGDTEGVYTAARFLVKERLDELQDYDSPFSRTGEPPLWLSVVSHGSYWPVALMDSAKSRSTQANEAAVKRSRINLPEIAQHGFPAGLRGEGVPISQRLAILAAFLLSLLHAGKCLRVRMLSPYASRYHINEEATRLPKLALQLLITALGCVMLSLVYEPREMTESGELTWRILFLLAVAVLSVAGGRVGWRLWARSEFLSKKNELELESARTALLIQVGLTVLIFAATYGLWHFLWRWLPGADAGGEGLRQFFFFRAQHPLSGASPVFPLLIALNGVALVMFAHMGRLKFTPLQRPRLPENTAATPNCPGEASVAPLTDLLAWPPTRDAKTNKLTGLTMKFVLFSVVVLACLMVTGAMDLAPEMLESWRLQTAVRLTMLVVLIGIIWDLTMASVLWRRLKVTCLDPLESSSLRTGFSSICGLTWKSLWLMPQSAAAQNRALLRAMEQASRSVMVIPATQKVDGESMREASEQMWERIHDGSGPDEVIKSFGDVQKRMAKMGELLLLDLKRFWSHEEGRITTPDAPTKKEANEAMALEDKDAADGLLRQVAEEWIALLYIHYIRMVLIQIRSRLVTAAMLYVLLVWSATCYPFLNRHVLIIALSALVALLAFVVTATYASINKDPILSRTTENEPGKLDLDFYAKTASMVGIPLLGFVASQFPEVSSFLFSWIEPGMTAVK